MRIGVTAGVGKIRLLILAVVILQGVVLTATVPPARYAPERDLLQQLDRLDADVAVDGLYPRLAHAALGDLPRAAQTTVLRLTSLVISLATLLIVFEFVGALFPTKPYLPVGASLLLLLTPTFALSSAQATPEAFVAFLVVVTIVIGAWMLRTGVSLPTLAGVTGCFVLGVQSDWGFWWTLPPIVLTLVVAMVLPREDQAHWVAQLAVVVGIAIALAGSVIALRNARELLPLLGRTIESLNVVVASVAMPTLGAVWNLFRWYWAGPTTPGSLWYAGIFLWIAISLYGVWRFARRSTTEHVSARISAERVLALVFGGSVGLGALFIPGSVATWPAPVLAVGAPVLAFGWSHVVPAGTRPQWLLLGLVGMALLNSAALIG